MAVWNNKYHPGQTDEHCIEKIKTRHTLKEALVVITVYGTGHATKSDEFLERYQTILDPHPHPSEWSLSLEIMYMHFISGPHTSLRICNHIHYKEFAT